MEFLEQCGRCGRLTILSPTLGYCAGCIREHFEEVWPRLSHVHRASREQFGLPAFPPDSEGGVRCGRCHHLCRLGEGERGWCGARWAEGGKLVGGGPEGAQASFYFDPLPTNCVAEWVCAASGHGYPAFSHEPGPEFGWKNLAVFYQSCAFNCLFCQNWHFKDGSRRTRPISAAELAAQVRDDTACICFFGGDPTPQLPHALECARLARESRPGQNLRICFETSGAMSRGLLQKMADVALSSGGCIKFDLKAWSETVHLALTGVSNRRTLENFRALAARASERPQLPLLIASTLLVPGYVDEPEVSRLAAYVASLNPDIPYALLGFSPQFYLQDLPQTSREHAERCLAAAKEAGLRNVRLANMHLLGADYA
jgi:pyruvate formate lyase activating enzyme